MASVLLGFVATIITQLSKKLGISPLVVAAMICYGVTFGVQLANLITTGGFTATDLVSALQTFASIGTTSWAAAVGIYEILKPYIEKVIPSGEVK